MRLTMFLCTCVVVLSSLVWLFLSVWVTLHAKQHIEKGLLPIDGSVWTFLSALLTIAIGGKVAQYFKEPDNQKESAPDLRTVDSSNYYIVDAVERAWKPLGQSEPPNGYVLTKFRGKPTWVPTEFDFSTVTN